MVSLISGILLLFISVLYGIYLHSWKKKTGYPLRGIVKNLYYLETFHGEAENEASRLVLLSLVYSLLPVIWVIQISWKTDYSFMIALFPIIWYYYFLRFFMWEKSDTEEEK